MKRRAAIISLIISLTLFALIAAGCSLAETANPGNLDASFGPGGENGPGTGKWRPQVPRNNNQAINLYEALVRLSEEGTTKSNEYDRRYQSCFDAQGNWLGEADKALCNNELRTLAVEATNFILDFDTGQSSYEEWALANKDEDPPETPKEPEKPKEDPPTTESPGDEDPEPTPCCWCLTCVHSIDVEYVNLLPVPELAESPSS